MVKFSERRPQDKQQCLVCDKYEKRVRILTFNAYDECWDDEDGNLFGIVLENGVLVYGEMN